MTVPNLDVGSFAPKLKSYKWLREGALNEYIRGKVYVINFEATWCAPCKAAIPQLITLSKKFRNEATFVGINVFEDNSVTLYKLSAFVDSMRIDYNVALDSANLAVENWLRAANEERNGIPRIFVVNGEGRIAWIGHPIYLPKVLGRIIDNSWDLDLELKRRTSNYRINMLDDSLQWALRKYTYDINYPEKPARPDTLLTLLEQFVKKEPELRFAKSVSTLTFAALLQTDTTRAYLYGKDLLEKTERLEDPLYYIIIDNLKWYGNRLNLSKSLFFLGVEALQAEIDATPYPDIVRTDKYYHQMAEWYRWAGDWSKAAEIQQKAIDVLKSKKDFSAVDLINYEHRLQMYREKL